MEGLKFIQITVCPIGKKEDFALFGLAADGTVWWFVAGEGWIQVNMRQVELPADYQDPV